MSAQYREECGVGKLVRSGGLLEDREEYWQLLIQGGAGDWQKAAKDAGELTVGRMCFVFRDICFKLQLQTSLK